MFQLYLLVTDDNTFVLMTMIESIKTDRADEDKLLDKLKDDVIITITTVSGRVYDISMKHQRELYKEYSPPDDLIELRNIIIENWINLTKQE